MSTAEELVEEHNIDRMTYAILAGIPVIGDAKDWLNKPGRRHGINELDAFFTTVANQDLDEDEDNYVEEDGVHPAPSQEPLVDIPEGGAVEEVFAATEADMDPAPEADDSTSFLRGGRNNSNRSTGMENSE